MACPSCRMPLNRRIGLQGLLLVTFAVSAVTAARIYLPPVPFFVITFIVVPSLVWFLDVLTVRLYALGAR